MTNAAATYSTATMQDQCERRAPHPQTSGLFRVDQFGVDQQRQRRHVAVEHVEVDRPGVADQDQHRGRLADHAGQRQQDAADDARQRGGNNDPRNGLPFRNAQRVAGFPQLVGNQLEHFLGVADDDRQHQQHQRQRHRERALREAQCRDPQREDEQCGHDRRHAGQDVDHEGGHARERSRGHTRLGRWRRRCPTASPARRRSPACTIVP